MLMTSFKHTFPVGGTFYTCSFFLIENIIFIFCLLANLFAINIYDVCFMYRIVYRKYDNQIIKITSCDIFCYKVNFIFKKRKKRIVYFSFQLKFYKRK